MTHSCIFSDDSFGVCGFTRFRCKTSSHCMFNRYMCDGVTDCPLDNTDESFELCGCELAKDID